MRVASCVARAVLSRSMMSSSSRRFFLKRVGFCFSLSVSRPRSRMSLFPFFSNRWETHLVFVLFFFSLSSLCSGFFIWLTCWWKLRKKFNLSVLAVNVLFQREDYVWNPLTYMTVHTFDVFKSWYIWVNLHSLYGFLCMQF